MPLLVYTGLCILGVVQFSLWSQVAYVWDSSLTMTDMLYDYHGIRFFLVLPIFQISDWLGISYDRLFSVIVPVLIFVIALFCTESVKKLVGYWSEKRGHLVFGVISMFFIALSLLMNGRLMFAMAGSAILLCALLRWDEYRDWNNFLAVISAIVLCSVSTGTFLIVVAAFYFFVVVNIVIENPVVRRRSTVLTYAFLLIVLVPFITMLVLKIVEYFGGEIGSIVHMLDHGYGSRVMQLDLLVLSIGGLVLFSGVYLYRKTLISYWIISSLVIFYLAGGIFGISTALIVLPPLSVVLISAIFQILLKVEPSALLKRQ